MGFEFYSHGIVVHDAPLYTENNYMLLWSKLGVDTAIFIYRVHNDFVLMHNCGQWLIYVRNDIDIYILTDMNSLTHNDFKKWIQWGVIEYIPEIEMMVTK